MKPRGFIDDVGEIGVKQKLGHKVRIGFEEVVDLKRSDIMGLNLDGAVHVVLASKS